MRVISSPPYRGKVWIVCPRSGMSLFAISLSSRRISDHAGLPLPTGDHAIGILAAELDPQQPSGDPRVWGDARSVRRNGKDARADGPGKPCPRRARANALRPRQTAPRWADPRP